MRFLACVVLACLSPLLCTAQYGCGASLTWQDSRCQQASFGKLNSAWAIVSRHGEYAQNENECNIPGEVSVSNGNLVIKTHAQNYTCGDFNTDGSVNTAPASWPYTTADVQWKNFSFTYGTVTIRGKIPPFNTGTWPSWWLLGTNCQNTNMYTGSAPFGTCPGYQAAGYAELDIVECVGVGNYCQFNNLSQSTYTCHFSPAGDANFTQFHTYTMTWVPGSASLSVDGQSTGCTTSNGAPSTPMFLIIQTQTAASGSGFGPPNNANLPTQLVTDYVQVQDQKGRVIFYDDFQSPLPAPMLRPIAHLARLSGSGIMPGVVLINAARIQGSTAIE